MHACIGSSNLVVEHWLADQEVIGSMPNLRCFSLSKEPYLFCSSPTSYMNGDLANIWGSSCLIMVEVLVCEILTREYLHYPYLYMHVCVC